MKMAPTESPTAQRLFALMGGEENDEWFMERNIDRWEVIGNLKDWVDVDNLRSGGLGGDEDGLYNRLDDPYLTKNAKFDTLEEILLGRWLEWRIIRKVQRTTHDLVQR